MVERLLGEGGEIRIWDDQVLLGKLSGVSWQFIHDLIPTLQDQLQKALVGAEVVAMAATKALDREQVERLSGADLGRPQARRATPAATAHWHLSTAVGV